MIVGTICATVMQGQDHLRANISSITTCLGRYEQTSFLHSMLRNLSKVPQFLNLDHINHSETQEQTRTVGAGAAIISGIIGDSVTLKDELTNWIVGVSGDGFSHKILLHRAGIAALSKDKGVSECSREDLC